MQAWMNEWVGGHTNEAVSVWIQISPIPKLVSSKLWRQVFVNDACFLYSFGLCSPSKGTVSFHDYVIASLHRKWWFAWWYIKLGAYDGYAIIQCPNFLTWVLRNTSKIFQVDVKERNVTTEGRSYILAWSLNRGARRQGVQTGFKNAEEIQKLVLS